MTLKKFILSKVEELYPASNKPLTKILEKLEMATIEDLNFTSIVDESTDEAIERLRQIRLSRRTPVKKVSTQKTTSKQVKKQVTKKLNPNLAKELLDMIGDD